MKRVLLLVGLLFAIIEMSAASTIKYVDAATLTIAGKLSKTTNPYHRAEVSEYPSLKQGRSRTGKPLEGTLLRMSTGVMVIFETDSPEIWVKPEYGFTYPFYSMPMAATHGFNLYIEKSGKLRWAASRGRTIDAQGEGKAKAEKPLRLIANMDGSMKRCVLYLPLYSELLSLKVGVADGATIRAAANPFRHNIAVFGSSFTHGASASCAGQTWPAFFSRATGLHVCSYGMSAYSKLQPIVGEIIGKAKPDALICDSFSNPSNEQIKERIRPFINAVRRENPNMPIIFLRTIYRESRNFDQRAEKSEQSRIDCASAVMKDVVKEYKGVYYLEIDNMTGTTGETSADGVHPHSMGYYEWAKAIEKPVLKILKKHGLK